MSGNNRPPMMDLRSKITGKGRKRKSDDAPISQGPKRRRTVQKEGIHNATEPIGSKELENICRKSVPEKGILELVSKTERFEALLASEEIEPDLLKLVIPAFRLLCSATTIMSENAEKLLRSAAAKKFMTGPVLSAFINEMPFSESWKDESERVAVLNDLAGIFLALLQRLGESIVYKLPLPQLSTSWDALRKKKLIEDTGDLDKKIRQLFEFKDQVIRRAKSAHDQESWNEPPQNFRELDVIPQLSDLSCRPFLRENITDRKFRDLDHYLDVQFRLLREDFVIPLRDGIQQLMKGSDYLGTNPASKARRTNDVPVYHDVTVLYPVCSREGLVYRIMFDLTHPKVKRVNWERSKRLKYGTLVCLSSDEFNTLVFATVKNRDAKGLKVGELEVRFENVEMEEINQSIQRGEKFVMIESPAYFEAYRHVLEALKEIKPEEFPFRKHIVECCQDVGPPEYQVKKENSSVFTLNFTDVLVVKSPVIQESPASCQHEEPYIPPMTELSSPEERLSESSSSASTEDSSSSKERQSESGSNNKDSPTDMDDPMDQGTLSAEVKHEFTTNVYNWPDNESLGFNESQMRAFKMALTRKLAVIQGPPGTGKTYVGLKIARVLLQTTSLWEDEENRSPILMVSYTNHALDQFLEGLLPVTKDIVRVGGRSRNNKLDIVSLRYLQATIRQNKAVPYHIYRARIQHERETRTQRAFFERSTKLLRALRTSIVSMHVLGHEDYMLPQHCTQLLSQNSGQSSIDEGLLDWLGIRPIQHEEDGCLDDLEEFSTSGFDYDYIPSEDKDLDGSSLQVEALSVEDTDNPMYVREILTNEEVMTEGEEKNVDDIYNLEIEDRWKLYKLWRQRVKVNHHGLFQTRQEEYERALRREQEVRGMEEHDILSRACVIGMTTTCAARYRHILQEICPKIVLVEEAAEVLEAHIITSLTKGCEHLILIGDHQQLRPTPAVYELAKKYKLEVSLFERMVNVGIHCERLSVQHRMRPEIAALMKHIYDDLENHESVEKYENIKGMKKNIFFINHSHLEMSCDQTHCHVNEHEARYLLALCRYLQQQGYRTHQITLLTTYKGQMFAIRDCLREEDNETLRSIRLTTVDNFQGEENDIILLSLVRSNKNGKVGFIKSVNRACVALSRAKKAFYCIGNFDLLSKHSDIWNKIVTDLKATGSIGKALSLVCQIHCDERTAELAEDFKVKAPDGGCQRLCEVRLECGHACRQLCHPHDTEHLEYRCAQPCSKKIKGCDHDCPNRCWEECERHCGKPVTKKLPVCGHDAQMRCDTDPRMVKCKLRCEKFLSCGHQCQDYCGAPCTEKCKELVKRTDWPCGHGATTACSATQANCEVPCGDKLECGHKCSGTCGECRMGRIHKGCKLKCGRPLICSHVCKEFCRMPCHPCNKKCENHCVHSICPKRCGDLCKPCREKCSWKCLHYKCSKECGELCDRPICDEPCDKIILTCHHSCRGLMCEQECICTECMKNDNCDPITDIFFGTEKDEGARFIQLPDCKHIFEVKGLDSYMGISNEDTDVSDESHADTVDDSQPIQLKSCPRCKTPIRKSLRYGNVIKQQLNDIEKVKEKLLGEKDELERKKGRLYCRHSKMRFMLDEPEWLRLDRSIGKLNSEWMAAVLENKLTLFERFFDTRKKTKSILGKMSREVFSENGLQGQQFEDELCYLKKCFMSEGVTHRKLRDINTEFSRLNLLLELCLLIHEIRSLELDLEDSHRQKMTAVQEKLSSGKRLEDETLDEMMNSMKAIRQCHPLLSPLTEEDKKVIVSVIGLSKGHWFKCPKGHFYVIGECGGAMERSTCPECGAVIGGANHRLEEGNELAPEMDGASHPAWSEQANLQNYENLHDVL